MSKIRVDQIGTTDDSVSHNVSELVSSQDISSVTKGYGTLDDLLSVPTQDLVDGQTASVRGAEYKWDTADQEWVNVSGWISPEAWGLTASGDETAELQAFCGYASDNGLEVRWDGREYEGKSIDLTGKGYIKWTGSGTFRSNKTPAEIPGDQALDYLFRFRNEPVGTFQATSDLNPGDDSIELNSVSGIEPGDLLRVESTRLIPTDHRGLWHEGQMLKVRSISGTTVFLEDPIEYYGKANDVVTGTITSRIGDYTLELSNMPAGNAREKLRKLTITSGGSSGEYRWIVRTINTNQVQQSGANPGEDDRGGWPSGVQAGDSYAYEWITEVHHYKPAKLDIQGKFHFTREPHTGAASGDSGFRGFRVQGFDKPIVKADFSNFSWENISMKYCYQPTFHNSRSENANRLFNGSNGTGYGVSFENCFRPIAWKIRGSRNRRTLDFSGADGYTVHGISYEVSNQGGGTTYADLPMWPHGTEHQSVTGSHGSGLYCRYINSEGIDVYGVVNLRGMREEVINTKQVGYSFYAVRSRYGSGHHIHGVFCNDRFTESNQGPNQRWVVSNKPGMKIYRAVWIDQGRENADSSIMTYISDIKAVGAQECAVFISTNGGDVENLSVDGVDITPSSEGSTLNDFRAIRASSSCDINNCYFDDINIRRTHPTAGYSGNVIGISLITPSGSDSSVFSIPSNGIIRYNGSWYVDIPHESLVRIPLDVCGTSHHMVSLCNVRPGSSRPQMGPTMIESMSAADRTPTPNKLGVEISATYLTDPATQVTSGSVGVNINNSEGVLTIANNSGATQGFAVSIS